MSEAGEHQNTEQSVQLEKPLVLVGMMGSGKTHLGRLLASRLGLAFYDTDLLVEERAGCSTNEIFARYGQEKFREAEKNAVLDVLGRGACVIATGGGAVTNPQTLAAIKEGAVSLWLSAPVSVLLERVGHCANRPLLQQDDPQSVLENLLEVRGPLYAQADLVVDTAGHSVRIVLEKVIKTLSAHLDPRKE